MFDFQGKLIRMLLALCLFLSIGIPVAVAENQDEILLNLRDVDIRVFIETVADVTGKQFLVDPRVTGKVTVFSGEAMTKASLYATFLSVLQVHGFAAVESGNTIKVMPDLAARQVGSPMQTQEQEDEEDDRFITKVIRLQEVDAQKAVTVLRPLVPPNAHLAAHPDSNTLVVSDRAANIARLEQIIKRIDKAYDDGIEVVRLDHANAADLLSVISSLRAVPAQNGGSPMRMSADERSNSILISGSPGERLKLRSLIAHLDIPLEDSGNTHVIFLKYASAEDLASLLQQRYKRAEAKSGNAVGAVDIQAHVANNALLVSAPPREFSAIQSVVRQLDIRRAQVLVEAVIAEVSSDFTKELGVQMALGDLRGDATTPALITNLGSTPLSNLIQSAVAGAAVALPQGISAGVGRAGLGVSGAQWGVLLNALSSDASTNILSTPVILATDNEDAEIVVGQNVPFVTGQYTSTGTAGTTTVSNPFQTIDRKDIGITLKIKPQINEGSSIRLEIDQEVSSLATTSVSTSDIVTNKRSIKTTITVEDGQIVVLGGLIDDRTQGSTQKVPLLGDIPVVGELFSYNRTNKVKRNLMVFLRPMIVLDPEVVSQYSDQKYSYLRMRQLQGLSTQRGLVDQKQDELPPDLMGLFNKSVGKEPTEPDPPAPSSEKTWSPFPFDYE